jgi:hypothetical protein
MTAPEDLTEALAGVCLENGHQEEEPTEYVPPQPSTQPRCARLHDPMPHTMPIGEGCRSFVHWGPFSAISNRRLVRIPSTATDPP